MSSGQDSYFYRYRPVKAVLDEFHELERGETYFSTTDELNDPMEGFKDLTWLGDEIVWRNFLKDYVLCLLQAVSYCLLAGEAFDSNVLRNLVFLTPEQLPNAPIRAIYERVSSAFLAEPASNKFLSLMAKRTIPVRRNELTGYLRALHGFALQIVTKELREHGILSSPPPNRPTPPWPENLRQSAMAMMEIVTQIESSEFPAEHISEALFAANEAASAQLMLIHEYNLPDRDKQLSILAFTHRFPATYVRALDRLVHRDWYVACFAKAPDNHSMWSAYAHGHRGVCLIFKATPSPEGRPTLGVERVVGASAARGREATIHSSVVPHVIEPVRYSGDYPSIDFFRSLASIRTDVNNFWYLGTDGTFSTCREATDADASRNAYWQTFRESTLCKTPEWAHEKEFRIIVHSAFDMSTKESRKLRYRFEDLAGIAFGLRTDWEDKLKIIRIIDQKCMATGRTEFKFYEVRYLHTESRFQLFSLDLIKFNTAKHAD